MELYERIRRDRTQQGWGIRRLAREHGVHRRDVRAALTSAEPTPRAEFQRPQPALGRWTSWIDAVLENDREQPRKQRHTARRIWNRLREEEGATLSEITVSRYVRERKRELLGVGDIYVPMAHAYGEQAEVDFGESMIDFPWGREKVSFFEMRACASGAVFRWPVRRQTQQAFLEAHVLAFAHFGGCFARVRYDNLPLAVYKVLRGHLREETARFIVLRSHYLFASDYCQPGVRGAHEKGGVEGECGYFRRNHLVPVPKVAGWAELEVLCLDSCRKDLRRRMEGRERTVAQEWEVERGLLQTLPDPLDTRLRFSAEVDDKGRVRVKYNRYSVPVLLGGLKAEVELSTAEVVVRHRGNEVARHARSYGRGQDVLVLDHYLEVLRYKPRAFSGSLPLRQAIAAGTFPQAYQELHAKMVDRLGDSEAARQMVDVLFLHRRYAAAAVLTAVQAAVDAGAYNFAAVALGVRGAEDVAERPQLLSLRLVVDPQVPLPDCRQYDRLLTAEVES